MRIISFILFSLFLVLSNCIQSQNLIFDSLEIKAEKFPVKLLQQIKSNNFPQISASELMFLRVLAYEQIGEIQKSDSLFKLVQLNELKNESSELYVKFSLLAAQHHKLMLEFEKSFAILQSLISYAAAKKDTLYLLRIHLSKAELYRASNEIELGLKELEKAENLIEKSNKPSLEYYLASLYNRKAALLSEENLKENAKVLSLKSLKIARKLKNPDLIAIACNELGAIHYDEIPANPRSKIYLEEAIEIWDKLKYDIQSTNARVNLARYYIRIDDDEKAIHTLLDIKEMVDEAAWETQKSSYYEMLGRIYARKENYKEAYLNKRKANKYLFDNERKSYNQRIAIYAYKLDIQEKEKKIELAELKLRNEKNEKQVLYVILISVLLFFLGGLFIYSRLRKQKNELSAQRDLLEEQKEVIEGSNIQLNELVHQKESLLKEVNHRVNSNLTVLSSLLNLQSINVKGGEAKEAFQDSQLRIKTISLIHKSLYQNNNQLDFNIYLRNLFKSIQSLYWTRPSPVSLIISIEEYQPELKESVPIGMILNELMTNSFKYAFDSVEDPTIYITATSHSISYHDNGPGFETDKGKSSLGLKLISIFAIQLNGKVSYNKINQMTQTIIQWT